MQVIVAWIRNCFKFRYLIPLNEQFDSLQYSQILIFIRSHTLLNDGNQVGVWGINQGGTTLLHASPGCLSTLNPGITSSSTYDTTLDTASSLLERLKQSATEDNTSTDTSSTDPQILTQAPIAWGSALLRALCFIRKLHTVSTANNVIPMKSRILCLSSTPDDPGQYLVIMNAIFAAQRSDVIIDACVLGAYHSPFMQQATYLTGGTYLKPTKPGALVEYLLVGFEIYNSKWPCFRIFFPNMSLFAYLICWLVSFISSFLNPYIQLRMKILYYLLLFQSAQSIS